MLHILTANYKFGLESDKNKTAARAALFQFQQGQRVLIGYNSEKLSQPIQITELEVIVLVCNMHGLSQLLKHHCFEVVVYHKSIKNFQKRNERTNHKYNDSTIVELQDYTFNLKYLQVKKMIYMM